MENAISGLVVTLLTQVAKNSPSIPVGKFEKGKVRALVVGLSLISAVATAYIDGTLLTGGVLNVVGDTIANWIFSIITYYGLVK